ncbi:hypothetical protein ILUMI_21417 [Ignelater luminosus]|uniref:Uncharacterized protein n=1 Tax=Ignelater luminosus TaxID=2038154 RepID=A0A8K0G1E6_IGNLU|nr:hypothetical protein ILUMI_21417 [Ignelater luminosus]
MPWTYNRLLPQLPKTEVYTHSEVLMLETKIEHLKQKLRYIKEEYQGFGNSSSTGNNEEAKIDDETSRVQEKRGKKRDRENAKRQSLGNDLNIARMYQLFKEECQNEGMRDDDISKQWLYRHIFHLGFKAPATDTCGMCDEYQMLLKKASDVNQQTSVQRTTDFHETSEIETVDYNRKVSRNNTIYDDLDQGTEEKHPISKRKEDDLQKWMIWVGAVTSRKRGINVTLVAYGSAASVFIPPLFLFFGSILKTTSLKMLLQDLEEQQINQAGRPMSIYDIAQLVGIAYLQAFSSDLRVSGIWPLYSGIFTEDEFLPSEATNLPPPSTSIANEFQVAPGEMSPEMTNQPKPSILIAVQEDNRQFQEPLIVKAPKTPEQLRQLPRASPRKEKKAKIEEQYRKREQNKVKAVTERVALRKFKESATSSSNEDVHLSISYADSSDNSDLFCGGYGGR